MADETQKAPESAPTAPPKEEVSIEMATLQNERALAKFESPFESVAALRFYDTVAARFAKSSFVPKHFQGKPDDCLVAINLAMRMREDPLMVIQNCFVVSGTPGFKTQFMIARANVHGGLRSKINWETEVLTPETVKVGGETGWDFPNVRVTAFATDEYGNRIEATVTSTMAIREGWTSNAKYKSMPLHMLEWRAAAFLVRKFCPEVMLGMQTIEELEDMRASGHLEAAPSRASIDMTKLRVLESSGSAAQMSAEQPEAVDAEVVEETGTPPPPEDPKPSQKPGKPVLTPAEVTIELEKMAAQRSIPPKAIEEYLMTTWGIETIGKLTTDDQRRAVAKWIKNYAPPSLDRERQPGED